MASNVDLASQVFPVSTTFRPITSMLFPSSKSSPGLHGSTYVKSAAGYYYYFLKFAN